MGIVDMVWCKICGAEMRQLDCKSMKKTCVPCRRIKRLEDEAGWVSDFVDEVRRLHLHGMDEVYRDIGVSEALEKLDAQLESDIYLSEDDQ
jgi:hypothetical protein